MKLLRKQYNICMKFIFAKPKSSIVTVSFTEHNKNRVVEEGKEVTALKIANGKRDAVRRRELLRLIRKIIRSARDNKLTAIAVNIDDLNFPNIGDIDDAELGRLFAENALMADYEFTTYKTEGKEYRGLEEVYVENVSPEFKEGVKVGEIVGEAVNTCRELSNTPGGDMTPTALAEAALSMSKGTGIKTTILEREDAEKLGMGLVLGVDKASAEPMKFIVMEYFGGPKNEQPIVLVGKGITFDTGGINLKPSEGGLMNLMNQDMSGGAAVIAAIVVAEKLTLKKNIVTLVPAVENAISGSGMRPGDVLTSMEGKTIEVLNTDAEGRLILADALTYAKRYTPRLVVDVATLTGAMRVTFGQRASGLMTPDATLQEKMVSLGERSGDYVWPLPLWDEYFNDIKSDIADFANQNTQTLPRNGGSITAGIFLKQFAKDFPLWAHLDIASRMESIPEDNLGKGAAGAPVRLLVRLIETH